MNGDDWEEYFNEDDYWEGYFDDDPVETDELDEWGCLFGNKCLMPGEHMKKECHTVEMMEAWVQEVRSHEDTGLYSNNSDL